jgi:Uma2 family endonuclease
MVQVAFTSMSPDAFLAWERDQPERHHYVRGEIFAMAGGSARHSFLSGQMIRLVGHGLLGGPCNVHTADLRLGVAEDHFVYADAVVVCRPMLFRTSTTDVVTNPSLVVEVLSKSTESYDRGDKLAAYLALASVQHVLLVSQRKPRIELYTRHEDDTFRYEILETGARVTLDRLEAERAPITLRIDEIYADAFELAGEV